MKISVTTKPKSRKELVKKISDFIYQVAVKEEAKEGKANKAVIESLAEYFKIPKSSIRILSGENIKQKIVEIPLTEDQVGKVENLEQLQQKLF